MKEKIEQLYKKTMEEVKLGVKPESKKLSPDEIFEIKQK